MTDQPASTAPLAADLPAVQGCCPACGTAGLFLGNDGYITCSLIDCPQPDAATEVIADFWEARQHGAFTFCPQSVGHVTMAEFAKKITEKATAVAQRAEAVRYANEQKQRAKHAEAAVERGRAYAHELRHKDAMGLLAALDEPGPAATEATQMETTARVLAALHRSAEQDLTRVIALYEQWVKAGPPPLGASTNRWWDARLVELHDAILPPTN